jgi:predicted ATPase
VATKGLGAAEVRDTHNRARELCQQIGETPELFPVLWGISAFYCTRAEWKEARTLVEQLLRLAQRTQDPAFLLQAYLALGMFMFCRGEFVSARGHLEQATLYNPRQYRSQAFRYGVAPEVFCCSYAAQVLWVLGYPEQALRSSREALTLAQEVGHPLSVAFALSITAFHHWYRREESLAQERAQEALTLATEHGFAEVLAWATVVRGWAQAGKREEGVLQVRQGLTACRVIGVELAQPSRLALLAEAHGKVGQTEEGLKVLAEALAQVDTTGERTHEAELYRLRGELTLAQSKVQSLKSKAMNSRPLPPDPRGEAEACFLKAIDIARRQQAKSLELRAVMSLSRLWQRQGRKTEARRVLAEVYDWFTEGFDTRDLQEAQALLKELV